MTKLTGSIETLVEGLDVDRAELWITSPSLIVDDEIKAGGLVKVPFKDGRISIDLLPTDADTDPTDWVYGLQVRWRGGHLPKVYAEVTGDNLDLADVVAVDPTDPVYLPAVMDIDRVLGLQAILDSLADAQDAIEVEVGTKASTSDLTSGLALKADQADLDAIEVTIEDTIDDALSVHAPGVELAYAERLTPGSTTATSISTPANITGLSFSIVGTGRPVEIELYLSGVWHSVADTAVNAYIAVNGLVTSGSGLLVSSISPKTNIGPAVSIRKRMVLTNGVTYSFQAGVYGLAAGTTVYAGAAYQPNYLAAVAR